jgi:hypothetical protein
MHAVDCPMFIASPVNTDSRHVSPRVYLKPTSEWLLMPAHHGQAFHSGIDKPQSVPISTTPSQPLLISSLFPQPKHSPQSEFDAEPPLQAAPSIATVGFSKLHTIWRRIAPTPGPERRRTSRGSSVRFCVFERMAAALNSVILLKNLLFHSCHHSDTCNY